MKKILEVLLKIALLPTIVWLGEVDKQAPVCCKVKATLTGHHTSLLGETLFYQCEVCKKVFTIDNEHKGISLWRLWRTIFMPGKAEE